MMPFAIGLRTSQVKKMKLHMLFLMIMQELKLIRLILCLVFVFDSYDLYGDKDMNNKLISFHIDEERC